MPNLELLKNLLPEISIAVIFAYVLLKILDQHKEAWNKTNDTILLMHGALSKIGETMQSVGSNVKENTEVTRASLEMSRQTKDEFSAVLRQALHK